MSTNTTIVATLEAQPCPPDRECNKTGTEILKLCQDFLAVTGLASGNIGGGVTTPTNNTAAQALAIATQALAISKEVQGTQRERRASLNVAPLPPLDSIYTISWAPPMPNTLYETRITLVGDDKPIGAKNQPGFRVLYGSQTLSSVRINFGNIQPDMSFLWVVEQLAP